MVNWQDPALLLRDYRALRIFLAPLDIIALTRFLSLLSRSYQAAPRVRRSLHVRSRDHAPCFGADL
jgi:hypothetical protein